MKLQDFPGSLSEDHGIAAVPVGTKQIYSVGISTGGIAEIRMAQGYPQVHIIASTVDNEGVEFARNLIAEHSLTPRIRIKLEDVTKTLPYPDGHFDYVYARLVLHYLTKQQMDLALAELLRVLRPSGSLFVVVRTTRCDAAHREGSSYDPTTGITTYPFIIKATGEKSWRKRYFQSEQSISDHLTKSGFKVAKISSYNELLYDDFMRTIPGTTPQDVIEILGIKSGQSH